MTKGNNTHCSRQRFTRTLEQAPAYGHSFHRRLTPAPEKVQEGGWNEEGTRSSGSDTDVVAFKLVFQFLRKFQHMKSFPHESLFHVVEPQHRRSTMPCAPSTWLSLKAWAITATSRVMALTLRKLAKTLMGTVEEVPEGYRVNADGAAALQP